MRDDLHPPTEAVRACVRRALAEDVGPLGDLTGSLLAEGASARGAFVARQGGVIAGVDCVRATFDRVDSTLVLVVALDDGAAVAPGGTVATVSGSARSLVLAERTALNFLCHLSGVATTTRRYVEAARAANPKVRVLDTRKTTPGLRALEKAAVRAGGGTNHRGSLSDAVLVKDNHLFGLSIGEACRSARERWPGRLVEVECERLDQVESALSAGAGVVLCDNMTPGDVAEAVAVVRAGAAGVLVEASGGITLDNIADFAAAGCDLVSVGALTHSAPILDIGLDLS